MYVMEKSTLLRKFAELEHGEMTVLEYAIRFEELTRYGYATMDIVIKRNKKFICGLRPELTRENLPHLRDLCDVVVEIALRNEEMAAFFGSNFFGSNKEVEAQGGQNQKRKFFNRKGVQKR